MVALWLPRRTKIVRTGSRTALDASRTREGNNHTMSRRFASLMWRLWYPLLTGMIKDSPVVFLNYGYAGDTDIVPKLEPADEADRPCIQLYHRVVSSVDLRGLRVLEMSCGHGGGASYIVRYLKPFSLHAVDRNPRAINFCRRTHNVSGLTFSCGNALKLDFADNTFDAVINVEASHCYPDLPRFLQEVRRVLRPGGHFLYADFRRKNPDSVVLHGQVEQSGLETLEREDIGAGVVRGMHLNSGRNIELIHRLVPKTLQTVCKRFAGVEGSVMYRELAMGDTTYFRYVLRKRVVADVPTLQGDQ